jgi:hypothetical protein
MQKELGEKRANWVTALQEYDLEIKPAKLLKVKVFAGEETMILFY